MPDYFVDPASGDDSTGDGSGLNPWKTLNKAIGSGKAVGATLSAPVNLYVAGGTTSRGNVAVEVIPSLAAPLRIIGDRDGAAFGAAGVANPKTGPVTLTNVAADGTSMGGTTLNLARGHVAVERLRVVAGPGGYAVDLGWLFGPRSLLDCEIVFCGNGTAIYGEPYDTSGPQDWLIDRCDIVTGTFAMDIVGTFAAGSRLRVRSSRIVTAYIGLRIRADLETTIQNSLIFGRDGMVSSPTTIPSAGMIRVYGSILSAGLSALAAATAGQIIENGNLIAASTPRQNVAAGADSRVVGDLELGLGRFGDHFAPLPGSRAVGWGSYGTTPALDLYGRPFAAVPACGPIEWFEPEPPEPGGNTYIFQTEG